MNNSSQEETPNPPPIPQVKKGRRCCGFPLWAFIVVNVVVMILIAAAIIIPLAFFVIRNQNVGSSDVQPALQQCQAQLTCANGGTNVVNQGLCSCICTNGFTGNNCTVSGATGCTTTALTGDTNIKDVTLGDAIPRLIQQAQANFSIPLSATTILAKFNAENLSCSAENALVTFDGQSTRQSDGSTEVTDPSGPTDALNAAGRLGVVDGIAYDIVTVLLGDPGTTTVMRTDASQAINNRRAPAGLNTVSTTPTTFSTIFATTVSLGVSISRASTTFITPTTTRTITTTINTAPTPTATFTVTEETLDFARVAVLFILQEETLDNAETAQGALQNFFSSASAGKIRSGYGVSTGQAMNITLGNGNSVDLIRRAVDTGGAIIGGTGVTA